ncbi:MAG TPA: hypothetical protein VMU51_18130 [Mycobacteriales bacterium]|nr:hypothetical protein [Mycobacteriales bacterium]
MTGTAVPNVAGNDEGGNDVGGNEKVYIHEFIDIIGPRRADYLYHMTANYAPIAQQERGQQCFGVWGVVGSTGRWPQVVNLWEEHGFAGLAASFGHETGHPTMQDPKLARWWARAASYRSGGTDRILAPAPWSPTIAESLAAGVRGEVYAHELVTVPPGQARGYLAGLADLAGHITDRFGWRLAGAWRTALADDAECLALWAIPAWAAWADFEQAALREPTLGRPPGVEIRSAHRILLVDAPLSPMRIGRQPSRADRSQPYDEA